MNTLVSYDMLIVWKGARGAFSTWLDYLLLLLALTFILPMAAAALFKFALFFDTLARPATWLAAAATGLLVERAVARRLFHLELESIVSRAALRPGPRQIYRLFWNAVPLTLVILISTAGSHPFPSLLGQAFFVLIAYGAGAVGCYIVQKSLHRFRTSFVDMNLFRTPPSVPLSGATRRNRIYALIISRTGVAGPGLPANVVIFGVLGAVGALTVRLAQECLSEPLPELLAAFVVVLTSGALMRQHPPLFRYLLYLGIGPLRPALVPAIPALFFATSFALGCLSVKGATGAILVAVASGCVLIFVGSVLLRAAHFATKPSRVAKFAIQIDIFAILLAGIIALPLAPAVFAGRLYMLQRRARRLKYQLT